MTRVIVRNSAQARPDRRPGTRGAVLVIDDAEFVRVRCRNLLKAWGYKVIEAGDGREGLALYLEYRPDAVLLDIAMPGMDGLTALKSIRSADPYAKVVIMTSFSHPAVIAEAYRMGARDFVSKPFESADVLAKLERAAGLKP